MPCCEISDLRSNVKTIIAVRHFGLGGRESLETAVNNVVLPTLFNAVNNIVQHCYTYCGLIQAQQC